MKLTQYILFLSTIVLLSCEKNEETRLGFDSPFDKESTGLTLASVGKNVRTIYLEGLILLNEGEVEITLTDPDGNTAYSNQYHSAGRNEIYQKIESVAGIWKLTYTSFEGTGKIDLHVRY